MSFKIIRNDITKVRADAIVNTANPMPAIGSGTDASVYTAAGSELLLEARKKIGEYLSQKSRKNIDARRARATGINNAFLCLKSESIAAPVKCSSLQEPITPIDIDAFIEQQQDTRTFVETLQKMIADRNLANAEIYKKANIDRKYFSKIINTKDYVPKKQTVMALGLALNLPLKEYEAFLASAGYAFMPSEKFDVIIKYCVINKIYNLMKVDTILFSQNVPCFSS